MSLFICEGKPRLSLKEIADVVNAGTCKLGHPVRIVKLSSASVPKTGEENYQVEERQPSPNSQKESSQ